MRPTSGTFIPCPLESAGSLLRLAASLPCLIRPAHRAEDKSGVPAAGFALPAAGCLFGIRVGLYVGLCPLRLPCCSSSVGDTLSQKGSEVKAISGLLCTIALKCAPSSRTLKFVPDGPRC